jgi:hypothetical protein
MKLKLAILSLVISLWASSNANANLISNGDFESTPGLLGWEYNDYVAAWDDANNIITAASLSNGGVMWQAFSTEMWAYYMLSFSYQAAPDTADTQFVNVTIFDNSLTGVELFSGDIEVTNASEWMSYSTIFQALTNTSVVRFSYNPTQSTINSVLIDNVQVEKVDEPLPVFLTSLGLLVLMFKRKYAAKG